MKKGAFIVADIVKKYGVFWQTNKALDNILYIEDPDTVENWYILVQNSNNETIFVGYHKSSKRTRAFSTHIRTTTKAKTSEHIVYENSEKIKKYINQDRKYEDYREYFLNCNFYVVGESKRDILLDIDPLLSKYIERLSNDEYQIIIENIIRNDEISYKKKKRIEEKKQRILKQYLRDPQVAAYSKQQANYKCESDPLHETFISEISKQQYVEAHHLIPMKYQNMFEQSLDIPENIVALCPNCHRKIHYGNSEYKNKIIEKLYNKRRKMLEENDIKITLEQLYEMY